MVLKSLRLLACCAFGLIANPTVAQQILTIIDTNRTLEFNFSLQDLESFEQTELQTANDFVDGLRLFLGPLARRVIEHAGGNESSWVTLTAANDYQVEIAAAEFYEYDVILALKMDGVPLLRRDKGPIWVIYPMSDFAELRDPVFNNRLIWQLVHMSLK